MNTVSSPNPPPGRCPRCDAAIPPEAPGGLCPRCVLLGAATPSESGGSPRPGEPPPLGAVQAAFPQLEVEGLIGRGGMGFVYRARQPQLDRPVALKLLPVPAGADPTFAERFAREGRLLARLNHPNIVAVYEFGQAAGFAFLLLEFVDGVNLRQAMQAGRFSSREALAIVPKICDALQFAHEHGVLHRDIKPENILLDAAGRVKIADFGIAKLVGDRPGDVTLTASGARLGTPHYMAPEQVEKPSEVDHRADIYSLGVVFYELLTGELPLGRFAAPSAKADLDSRVDAIVLRALAKERELRQQSAGEVKTEVEGLNSPVNAPAVASRPQPSDRTARLTGWAVVGAAVPAVAMGVFAGTAVLSDSGWNPGPEELRVTLGIWLAAFVTPLAGVRLLRLGQRGAGEIRRGTVGAALATGLLLGLTCIGGLFSLSPHFAGLLFALLPALAATALLLRATWNRSGRESWQPPGSARPNPWPHRLFWLLVGLVALPASAIVTGLLGPMLQRASGGLGGITAGLIPMTVGALLVWLFWRTRPTAAQVKPREEWNPWPKRIFVLVIALVVLPAGLVFAGLLVPYLIWSRAAVRPPLPTPLASSSGILPGGGGGGSQSPATGDERSVQLIRTERVATPGQVRLRWELRSPVPASVRLSLDRRTAEVQFSRVGDGDFRANVTARFERQKDDTESVKFTAMVEQVAPREWFAEFSVTMSGEPQELLAKAYELVSGDLSLKFNTPVWIAFVGLEQVRLEVIPEAAALVGAQMVATNAAASKDATATLELELAENWLQEIRKRADLGLVAPQGQEVRDAELAVAVAKANLQGDALAAAEAKLRHAETKLMIKWMEQRAGRATEAELNEVILAVAKARIPVIELERQRPDAVGDPEPRRHGAQDSAELKKRRPDGEFRAVLQNLPPSLGHAASFRVTAWTNGVARPLPEFDFTLPATPRPFSLEWHLKPVGTDGEFDLWVTSEINEDVSVIPQAKVRVNLGAFNRMFPFSFNPNPTFVEHPVRCWTFLPRWVAGKPETDVETTHGWGISVDVGPPDAFTPTPPSEK